MANNINLITKYSTKAWDKIYKAESCSSVLDGKEGVTVQWTGAKTVKIAKFNMGGLKNYYRNSNNVEGTAPTTGFMGNLGYGYQASEVGLTWEEFTVKMDRAAAFPIEYFDNEETDGLVIGAATTEVSRLRIIPEVDAYTFSTIAGYCSEEDGNLIDGTSINSTNALESLNAAFLYFDEREIPAEDQIIFASPKFMNYLRNDKTELTRILTQADYDKSVKFKLTEYEGRKLVVVPPKRFKTLFTTSVTSQAGGYGFAEGSKEILFMVVTKGSVMHVVKYNKIKILQGDVALAATGIDGYALYARIYHDVFVMDNKRYSLYTVTTGTASEAKADVTDDAFDVKGAKDTTDRNTKKDSK